MQWSITGPEGHILTYGLDPERGPWCSVNGGARDDATSWSFDIDQPVLSILVHLAQYSLFCGDDIADALDWLGGGTGLPGWPGRRRRTPRRLRGVLRVIEDLTAGGG